MKIIEQGKIPEDKTIQRTCGNCQSVLEWQHSEAAVVDAANYFSRAYKVDCPVCKQPVVYSI